MSKLILPSLFVFLFTVTDTLIKVVARVHNEWDARSLCSEYYITFERNQQYTSPITKNDNYGFNANQITISIGQKSFVWHYTTEVIQFSANTNF